MGRRNCSTYQTKELMMEGRKYLYALLHIVGFEIIDVKFGISPYRCNGKGQGSTVMASGQDSLEHEVPTRKWCICEASVRTTLQAPPLSDSWRSCERILMLTD